MIGNIKQIIIRFIRRVYHFVLSIIYNPSHSKIKRIIKKRVKANACFVISSLPMWRLQDLYDLLSKDSRFNATILLVPFLNNEEAQRRKSLKELEDFFKSRKYHYHIYNPDTIHSFLKETKIDIFFYQQLYSDIYPEPIEINHHLDKLIGYIPYGMITIKAEWIYNTRYTNLAWKLFYPTQMHLKYAREHSFNKAKNVVVVGEPNAKRYLTAHNSYPWKPQHNNHVKKVIWAPHYSVSGGYLQRSSFLWMADIMKEVVRQYEGSIQFVLKPHPRLMSELYNHPDWGKEKTDTYYELWNSGVNTQIETGEYIDLFMTSDAMIHDCGSFTAEYLYTKKPVLFASIDIKDVSSNLDYFGSECLKCHYWGSSKEDLMLFLNERVLGGDDPLREARQKFYDQVLINETSGDVGYNIYRVLSDELFSPKK